jgi:aldehyde:ferredoxin oxidoreductase
LYGPATVAQVVNAVTGWDTTLPELMEAGARRVNLMKVFNAREGFTREDDKLSPRLHQPLTSGVSDGVRVTEEETRTRQRPLLQAGRVGRGDGESDGRTVGGVGRGVGDELRD